MRGPSRRSRADRGWHVLPQIDPPASRARFSSSGSSPGPGDELSIKDGHPVVNGVEKADEPYTNPCGNIEACNLPRTITIPAGQYFMMGENRGASDDSRFWGPVPENWIIGEAFATYWPPNRVGSL